MKERVEQFVKFIFQRVFDSSFVLEEKMKVHISNAFEDTLADARYHQKDFSGDQLIQRIIRNQNELGVFLYRLGRNIYKSDPESKLLPELHWLMKDICGCEIYYSVEIGTGFRIHHGEGTVIGSRCTIGKGFVIHQGCTIGHKERNGNGPSIGNDVELGAGSQILGEIRVGDNVKIGAMSLVIHPIPDNSICSGIPVKIKE